MFGSIDDTQVFDTIIGLVFVDVMHVLSRQ